MLSYLLFLLFLCIFISFNTTKIVHCSSSSETETESDPYRSYQASHSASSVDSSKKSQLSSNPSDRKRKYDEDWLSDNEGERKNQKFDVSKIKHRARGTSQRSAYNRRYYEKHYERIKAYKLNHYHSKLINDPQARIRQRERNRAYLEKNRKKIYARQNAWKRRKREEQRKMRNQLQQKEEVVEQDPFNNNNQNSQNQKSKNILRIKVPKQSEKAHIEQSDQPQEQSKPRFIVRIKLPKKKIDGQENPDAKKTLWQ